MSQQEEPAGGGRRDGASRLVRQPFPSQFYPVPGYQGHPHAWFPPHPSAVPGQWNPSWRPPMGYPAPTPSWPTQQTLSVTNPTTTMATSPSDEYTVDTLRRIYNDDDGRVEIQRVKVQRRQPETGGVSLAGPESMSVVPMATIPVNERRPPPRKNRRKPEIRVAAMGPTGPYPWYPYMPYIPYPYPYPYYLSGCMWPPGAPSDSVSTWSGNEESEAVSSHQDSTFNSQRLESHVSHPSRDALPSLLYRPSSPAAVSHITDSHSLAPSDSVSVCGRKRETSLERVLRGPTPPPRTRSRAPSSLGSKSEDAGKTQEWISEMQRALRTRDDGAVKVSDKGSSRSDHTDACKRIPPIRKRRKFKEGNMSGKSSLIDLKDADDVSEIQSVVSNATFDESSKLSSELSYAFRKFERSVDAFKTEIDNSPSPLQRHVESPFMEISLSAGDAIPTDVHVTPPPLSDISCLAEKVELEDQRYSRYQRPRAISESISSLPPLATAKAGSAPDISHPIDTSTATIAPTMQSTTPTTQEFKKTESVVKTTEVISKVESVLDASTKPTFSAGTSQVYDPDVISSSKGPLVNQPSPPPHSSQSELSMPPLVPTPELTTKETEPKKTIRPPEHSNMLDVPPPDVPKETVSHESVSAASGTLASSEVETVDDGSRRHSRASSGTTFFSVRTTDDSHALDTDSTDIPFPTTDSATADENEDSAGSPAGPEDEPPWVLQRPEEAPTLNTAGHDECRNAWRAEVSLWRARLVVSLCRGKGLDRQDWATILLMVHHPLTMDLKLSLLHAPRLCSANSSMGPAVLRVALIQLAQHGEVLLQPEASRQSGWRCIRLDAGQAWTNVKGAAEILYSLGYQEGKHNTELRYKRRCSPEASVVARLTLDMLVLAEEFRLFLTGTHQYPNNVSSLFFSDTLGRGVVSDLPHRPPSSEGSFVSAQSEAIAVARPPSKTSMVTDEDTETLHSCVSETASHSKLSRDRSTSEDDVTLREEDNKKSAVEIDSAGIEGLNTDNIQQSTSEIKAKSEEGQALPAPPIDAPPINSDAASLPDSQSEHFTAATPEHHHSSASEETTANETNTPASPPIVTLQDKSSSKVDKDDSNATPSANLNSDNPEEHVYEEIDIIRAQTQSLRASSLPTESAPPPLPPKKKATCEGDNDSGLSLVYPPVEWSSASMPASLRGGSTGARRKKRRAPMPPEFLHQNWRESKEIPDEGAESSAKIQDLKGPDNEKKGEYRRSLNPFYEEIDFLEDDAKEAKDNTDSARDIKKDNKASNGNPFLEDTVKVTGHVGKNPFYDDVEILKKSDEYKDLQTKQYPLVAPAEESTSISGDSSAQQIDPPVVRPKRRAPRPPLSPKDTHSANVPDNSVSPQLDGFKSVVTNALPESDERKTESRENEKVPESNNIDLNCKQALLKSASLSPPSDSISKDNSLVKAEAELTTKPELTTNESTNTVERKSPTPKMSTDDQTGKIDAAPPLTPKQSRVTRTSLTHPKAPPPPPPSPAKSPVNNLFTDNSTLKEESLPPTPPPKAPLSLLDEIPYMDANEVKEARAQRQSQDPHHHVAMGGSPAAALKFSPILSRQPSLTLGRVHDADSPPDCPPPLPPRPPPESPPETPHTSPPDTPHDSPPETPHTSPPETPHVSPPETPHTSPPETPHTSPPATPRLSLRSSPLLPSRHYPQDPPIKTGTGEDNERVDVTVKNTDEASPVPVKTIHPETKDSEVSMQTPSRSTPSEVSQQEQTPHTPHPQNVSSIIHNPATGTNSVQSTTSEERYEIPDTSRAPPPRPPVPSASKIQQPQHQQQNNGKTSTQSAEYARYEIPEAPKHPHAGVSKESVGRVKAPETEERYEIPEVVKDQPLKRDVNGASYAVTLGRTSSPRRGEITAIFGPPKPPRKKRNNQSPPPRPPKNPGLIDGSKLDSLSKTGPRTLSTSSSSFTSSCSEQTSTSLQHKKPPKRRSWPFLLCDCLYVNCRTYDNAYK